MPSSVVPRISYYYLYYYYCCYYYLPLLLQQGLYSPTSSRIDKKFINAFQYALAELIYLLKTQTHTHIYGKKRSETKIPTKWGASRKRSEYVKSLRDTTHVRIHFNVNEEKEKHKNFALCMPRVRGYHEDFSPTHARTQCRWRMDLRPRTNPR